MDPHHYFVDPVSTRHTYVCTTLAARSMYDAYRKERYPTLVVCEAHVRHSIGISISRGGMCYVISSTRNTPKLWAYTDPQGGEARTAHSQRGATHFLFQFGNAGAAASGQFGIAA